LPTYISHCSMTDLVALTPGISGFVGLREPTLTKKAASGASSCGPTSSVELTEGGCKGDCGRNIDRTVALWIDVSGVRKGYRLRPIEAGRSAIAIRGSWMATPAVMEPP